MSGPIPFDTSGALAAAAERTAGQVQNCPPNQSHYWDQNTEALEWCLSNFSKGDFPARGGRNDWLAALALFCNESGVSQSLFTNHAATNWAAADFTEREIEQTISGVYQRRAAEHGSKAYQAYFHKPPTPGIVHHSSAEVAITPEKSPPPFPDSLYGQLPEFLQKCCSLFNTPHERDVMLLSVLTVLSGCFPGVGGTYDRRQYGLNLYSFILAPAASGKGTLNWAQRLARPYHKKLIEESTVQRLAYEAELAQHKAAGKGQHSTSPATTPPPRRCLFLPGNTSAAALLTHLDENDARGIICETEADTLSGAMGADFGNFSDVLRKAFHHEPVSVLRKTDRQYLDMERPALSIALTGTPSQLFRLLPTAEDGLVSRFLFYMFEQATTWHNVGPGSGKPLEPYIDALASEVLYMIEATPGPTETGSMAVEITLSDSDWELLNTAGKLGLEEALIATGENGASTAFRLGLIAFRIVGILTLLRCFESKKRPNGTLQAASRDVATALTIIHTARAHALAVLLRLERNQSKMGSRQMHKAQDLTNKIVQARALQASGISNRRIADQLGVSEGTIRNWLR